LAYASSGGIFNPVDYMPFVQLHLKGKKCQAINVIEQVTPSGCGANNGQLQITPLGGNPPYRIQWGKQAGYSKAVLVSGLSSGNYSYQVIDTFGCVQKGIIALPDSGSPILTLDSIRHENCFGDSLGYLKIKASGGTPPYQFSWADGSTDSLRAQLTADSYRLEVSDASSGGCKAYASYSIQGPREKLSAKALVQDNLCASDTLGEILWEIRGGVEPYSWLWSDTSLKKLHEKNLAPGRYHITFSDNNNCQYVDSAQIESNDSILVVGQVDDTSKTASITLTVSGGVSPYTFSWKSSVTGFSDPGTQNLTGLIDRGIYVATTIDSVGCSRVDTFTVAGTLNIQFSDEKQSELKIFPNPSTGRITLVWNSLESANLSIVDVHGRVVEEKYNATSGVQFELPQGIYWVLHHQEGHETQRLKVVVVN
jgi:hypothetical protein